MSTYIHVGYPKTASTWFYKNFLIFVKNIKVYDRKLIRKCFMEPDAFSFNVDKIKELFETNDKIDRWLSDDILLGRLRLGGVRGFITKEMANRLKLVFPDAKIILFIRNQIDILASAYLQYVKSGGNYGINRFFYSEKYYGKEANRLILLDTDYFLYDKVFEYYFNLFGTENVHIFLYEDLAENPQKFISDFATQFKLEYDENSISFCPENKGYSNFLLFTRRICNIFSYKGPMNKYYIFHIPKFNYLSEYLHDIANKYRIFSGRPDSKKLLGKINVKNFVEFYSRSNNRLKDEFGIKGLKKYNYPL